jgi:hypothetical protein
MTLTDDISATVAAFRKDLVIERPLTKSKPWNEASYAQGYTAGYKAGMEADMDDRFFVKQIRQQVAQECVEIARAIPYDSALGIADAIRRKYGIDMLSEREGTANGFG